MTLPNRGILRQHARTEQQPQQTVHRDVPVAANHAQVVLPMSLIIEAEVKMKADAEGIRQPAAGQNNHPNNAPRN